MTPAEVRRYARHISLSAVGATGQERLLASTAWILGDDLLAETATLYLTAAGVGAVRRAAGLPSGAVAVQRALAEALGRVPGAPLAGPAVVVRSGFDDDSLLLAARIAGVPVVVARARAERVDALVFNHAAEPETELVDVAPATADVAPVDGAALVVAGTLAACEALEQLLGRDAGARHLEVPLTPEGRASVRVIPWPPRAAGLR